MANWVNKHVAEITLACFAITAAATGCAYVVGLTTTGKLNSISDEIGGLKFLVQERFEDLEERITVMGERL